MPARAYQTQRYCDMMQMQRCLCAGMHAGLLVDRKKEKTNWIVQENKREDREHDEETAGDLSCSKQA